jgi:hypothetical protein
VQVPADPLALQVRHIPSHVESQQTPSAPQTPAAHSSVEPQVFPGAFLGWHLPLPSQKSPPMQSESIMHISLQVVPPQTY